MSNRIKIQLAFNQSISVDISVNYSIFVINGARNYFAERPNNHTTASHQNFFWVIAKSTPIILFKITTL